MKNLLFVPLAVFLLLGLWHLAVVLELAPSFILPSPVAVFWYLIQHAESLLQHLVYTSGVILCSFLLSLVLGMLLGMLGHTSKFGKLCVRPILLMMQNVPVFVCAPLLLLVFDYGFFVHLAMACLIVVPSFSHTVLMALSEVPQASREWVGLYKVSPWLMLRRLELPAALPQIADGMLLAVSLCGIGAIVGEWIGSSRGLGYQMIIANAKLQPELLFSCLILLLLVVFVFFTWVSWLRRFIWRKYHG